MESGHCVIICSHVLSPTAALGTPRSSVCPRRSPVGQAQPSFILGDFLSVVVTVIVLSHFVTF